MPRGSSPKRERQYQHIEASAKRRGGQRSHRGAQGPTYAQLYAQARSRGIKGRSSMTKAQLARALGR